MRHYPEPFRDVQSREKSGATGDQVEVGQCVVEELWEPDFSCDEVACVMAV